MKTLNIIVLILVVLIILVLLFKILFKYFNEKLSHAKEKLDDAASDCFEKLNVKYDLLLKLIEFIEEKYKIESKTFDNVKKLKIDSLDTFKEEKLLNKCFDEIVQANEDNKKSKDLKAYTSNMEKYESNELHIISLRTYYNRYTLEFNNLIKKFPYSIVAKLKGYKIRTLIEGVELDNNFNNDLEV